MFLMFCRPGEGGRGGVKFVCRVGTSLMSVKTKYELKKIEKHNRL